MRHSMGAVPGARGASGAGTFSLDALCCGVGVGMLDGILFSNGKGSVIVTTESSCGCGWKSTRTRWKDNPPGDGSQNCFPVGRLSIRRPSPPTRPLASFASLPDPMPAGASLAVAQLALQCNGFCALPLHFTVAVVKGGRVFVALVDRGAACNDTRGPRRSVPAMPSGSDSHDRYKAADAAYEAAKAIPVEKRTSSSRPRAASKDRGGAAVDKCRKNRTTGDAAFPGLTRQAPGSRGRSCEPRDLARAQIAQRMCLF